MEIKYDENGFVDVFSTLGKEKPPSKTIYYPAITESFVNLQNIIYSHYEDAFLLGFSAACELYKSDYSTKGLNHEEFIKAQKALLVPKETLMDRYVHQEVFVSGTETVNDQAD